MKCPLCQVEMRITKSRNIIDTSGEEPKLFFEQDLTCLNEKCENYETVVYTEKTELPVG